MAEKRKVALTDPIEGLRFVETDFKENFGAVNT